MLIHPGNGAQNPPAAEIPDDGIDQDCNGFDRVTCYADADHDGFGVNPPILNDLGTCTAPTQSPFNTDCNDTNPAIHPGVTETPDDTVDQDCNGADTIHVLPRRRCRRLRHDCRHDGPRGGRRLQRRAARAPSAGDCDDADANTYPGGLERCDGNDNTCAGTIPLAERDVDGDHFVACAGWSDTQGRQCRHPRRAATAIRPTR
jgi:hypothetical protein